MKKCVVITGTGRSGTSLTAGLMLRAGVALSKDLIEPSAQNPKGSFEDRRIQQLQREMLSELGPLSMPPPEGWLRSQAVATTAPKLREVVLEGFSRAQGMPWGFKDPHTAFTFPLWTRIFNDLKITPSVFLCVREPSAVITSLIRQYDFDAATAELFWLTKNLRAILDTGADLFIVNYKTLLTGEKATLTAMVEHAGIAGSASLEEIQGFIEPKLDRSATNSYEVVNSGVDRLWATLSACHGTDFDRAALLQTAHDIQSDLAQWSGWMNEVYRVYQTTGKGRSAEQSRAEAEAVGKLETARETIAMQLRELESAHLANQEAAEEISRLRIFARDALSATGKTPVKEQPKSEARRQAPDPRKRKGASGKGQGKSGTDRVAALKKERDRYKDEVIALYGSTTYQTGRYVRELRHQPLRGLVKLPFRIRNLLRVQKSKKSRNLP